MAEFYVNPVKIRDTNYELPCMEDRMRTIRNRIWRLKRELSPLICGKRQIGARLIQVCRDLEELEHQLDEIYRVTDACAAQYAQAEYENSRNASSFL